MSLSYDELRRGAAGEAVGIRCRTVLQPLGGPLDKVFPPTYSPENGAKTKYALEQRYIRPADGREAVLTQSVVLDSVASQANRLELALLDAIRSGELTAPVTSADFRPIEELAGLDRISDYEASHRIFDALLRDSYDGQHLFRNGPTGQMVTEARPDDAAGLYHHSPHTLVFGGWDSTGPRGARGAKYERAITSEIVALGVEVGVKTASRIDSVGIELRAGTLYAAPDGTWTLESDEAVTEGGKPKLLGDKGQGQAGRPSQANLGNVTPSIDDSSGGVTAREIVGTTVLSLIQLRRLRFPTRPDGSVLEDVQRREVELAARTVLAALGLAAASLAFEAGFDLRSRCVLVAQGPITFELVRRDGTTQPFELGRTEALKLVAEAADHATAAGLPWRTGELLLRPADRLVTLIRNSRDLAAAQGVTEDE